MSTSTDQTTGPTHEADGTPSVTGAYPQLAPYHAAALPFGALVALGADLWVRTHDDKDSPAKAAAPWLDQVSGERTGHRAIDGLLARGAVVSQGYAGAAIAHPFRDTLAAGLGWLHRTTQPEGAIVTHLGAPVHCRRVGDRRLAFYPGKSPIVVVDVVDSGFHPILGTYARPYGGKPERDRTAALLADLGSPVVDVWNGEKTMDTASYRLHPPSHPSLCAALNRYRAECPTHRTVFCGRGGFLGGAEAPCTWLDAGMALVRHPVWPGLPRPASEPQGAGDGQE